MRVLFILFIFSFIFTFFSSYSYAFSSVHFQGLRERFEIPTAPTIPPVPELPEISGDYSVPERPSLRLHVIAHPKPNHRNPAIQTLCSPDNDSSASSTLAGWHIKSGTMAYRVNYNTVPSSVGDANVATALTNAFSTWDAQISNVSFIEGSQTSVSRARLDNQNAVFWRRLSTRNTLAVAYMWYYPSTGELAEADLVYNTRVPWSYTPPNSTMCSGLTSYDIQDVGTHEVGHWTGLNDMYDASFVNNTMYGYADIGELKKDTLTTGDIQAVQGLYSSP